MLELVPVLFAPERAVLGVSDEMAILHNLASIFIEYGSEDFLWVVVVCEGAGIGCVSANIETIQHCFLGALEDCCFASGIVFWGVLFILFYVGRGRSICYSDILALYVQGGYA